jgi:rod shape-determining protein MreC
MQDFINFVNKYKTYITFAALVIMSLSLISMGEVSKIGGFRTMVIGSVGWLQDAFSWIPRTGVLKSENSTIRELNLKLSEDLTRTRHALVENQKLRSMLGLKDVLEVEHISSEVVGRTTIELRNYLTIDRGTKDSIYVGMAVRNDAGLVGIIIGATESYSLVEMINNRDIKIAVKVERSAINGILVWEGGEVFRLKNIPTSFDIEVGDEITTSNFSNKYPDGIPVGKIIEVSDGPGDIFYKVAVKPSCNFATLEEVFILKKLPDPERIKLISGVDSLLKARMGKRGKR